MKKVNLILIILCGLCLFGCNKIDDSHVVIQSNNNKNNQIYTLTFDYSVSLDDATKYAKDFGKQISKNGLDDFKISVKTDYGTIILLYEDGKLVFEF